MKKQTKLGLVLAAAALISVSVASLVSARGWVQEGADTAKKDADGNYWLINKASGYLTGIYTVNVKKADATNAIKGVEIASISTAIFKASGDVATLSDIEGAWDDFSVDTKKSINNFIFGVKEEYNMLAENGLDNTVTDCRFVFTKTGSKKISGVDYTVGNIKFEGYKYQSDKGEKSNIWIPFGALDGAGKTAKLDFDSAKSDQYYQVTPTDDYFLNCYWAN